MITLAPLALALLAQAAPVTTVPATAESFVPAHSFAVLRVKSLDRLSELALPFQRIEDEHAQPLDVLAQLGGMFGVQAQWELIDHTQPFVFAVSSSKLNQPAAFTVIATAKDAAALAADPQWKHSGWTCTQHSSFVTITTEPSDALLAQDSPLLMGLATSDVSVRVDVQEVMAQFGEEFRQGVQSGFEGGLPSALNDEQSTTAQSALDGMFDFVDSMETIGLTLHGASESMRLGFEMSGLPGSSLIDVAKVDPKPLEALARSIDPSAPI
ncbi:MAG: hypothetical protein SGI72_12575, partial [Planctomycetota bacterium]|nr:hypothetical protein [Planctomycetota bacterium]